MVARCRVCGSPDVDINIKSNVRTKTLRLYCSEECQLIGDTSWNIFWFLYSFILLLPIIPLWVYYLKKVIKGSKLKKQRQTSLISSKSLCFSCGKELDKLESGKTVCMHCGDLVHYCDLCQKHILFNEKTLQIEPCGHIFHKDELLEWTEKNDICPKCSVKIEFVDFQPD